MDNKTRFAAGVAVVAALAWVPAHAAPPPAAKPAPKPAAKSVGKLEARVDGPSGSGAVGKGDFEVSVFANINSTDGETFTMLGSSAGYFFTDQIQVQAGVSGFVATAYKSVIFLLGANYHFAPWKPQGVNNVIIPYVGAGLALAVTEVDTGFGTYAETNTDPAVRAGLKQFLGERISVNYELKYTLSDPAATDLNMGLSFYF